MMSVTTLGEVLGML